MVDQTKPLLVMTSTPGAGHVNPITTIAKALMLDGYHVTAVCASGYRKRFEDIGCDYVAIQGYGDYVDEDRESKWPERELMEPGPEQLAWTLEQSFIKVIPDQLAAVQKAITKLREEYPGRPVVLLNESAYAGSLPLQRGARGAKPDAFIGIGINPISITSADTPPFNSGLPLPTSPEQRAQYAGIWEMLRNTIFSGPFALFNSILKDLGGEPDDTTYFNDAPYVWPDRFLQMCSSSMMYPRSDAPPSLRFAGGMPKVPKADTSAAVKPAWWDEVAINSSGKDIVFVCQGTVRMDYKDIVIPAIDALKDRPNTLVIVVLGLRGATLDSTIAIPDNTRVIDYLTYDDILPLASVFVGNGGYGGVRASLSHGTPLVVAGESEDKTEMCAIIEWAGVAVNLRTGSPTSEAIRAGVDQVLSDPKYKEGAKRIQADMDASDPIKVITDNINEVLAGVKAS